MSITTFIKLDAEELDRLIYNKLSKDNKAK